MPFEEERDRPNIGYVWGYKRSLAFDAGHSVAHLSEFFGLLQMEGLPLPSLTVLTHWHWDHTFAAAYAFDQKCNRINDSYKKVVVVKDDIIPWRDEKGILYVGIREFLLDDRSLEL